MSVFHSDEPIAMSSQKAQRNMDEAATFLENDYRSIAFLMKGYYPLAILSRAAWYRWSVENDGRSGEMERAVARLCPLLLQSVWSSSFYDKDAGFSSRQEIQEKDWKRIISLVEDASRRYVRLIEARSVLALNAGTISREDWTAYRDALFNEVFLSDLSGLEIRESRRLFTSIGVEDEERLKQCYGMDCQLLTDQLWKLSDSLASGISQLVDQTHAINAEIGAKVDELMAAKPMLTRQLAVDEVVAKGGYKSRLEALSAKGNGYELFSVELSSLLSTQACIPLSATAGSQEAVMKDGSLSALYRPFIRFADRFYCFLGQSLYTALPHAMRKNLVEAGLKTDYSPKSEKIFTNALLSIFRQDDIEDVYTYKGYKADIFLLPSVRHINAWLFPETWATRFHRRQEASATRGQLGHSVLIVDPDGFAPMARQADGRWTVSLSTLCAKLSQEESTYSFLSQLFDLAQKEEPIPEDPYEEVFSEEEGEADDLPPDSWDDEMSDSAMAVVDENEYDRVDDDEKAREIASRLEKEEDDELPPDYAAYGKRSVGDASAYELPEQLKDEEVEEELEDLENDDYLPSDPVPAQDDGLDDEEDYLDVAGDLGEEEEYLDEAEEEAEEDVSYVPAAEDPDQLSLFDDDDFLPPSEEKTDVLVSLDQLEEETEDLTKEDGTTPEAEEAKVDELAQLDQLEDGTEDLSKEDGTTPEAEESKLDELAELDQLEDGTEDLSKEDGTTPEAEEAKVDELAELDQLEDGTEDLTKEDGIPSMTTMEEASEEEEADEAEDELPPSVDDDEPVLDSEEAEKEEAMLSSEPSEESQEAAQEAEVIAESALDEDDDEDLMADDQPPYGSEGEWEGKTVGEVAYQDEAVDSQAPVAAEPVIETRSLPEMLTHIVAALKTPVAAFDSFLSEIDAKTLQAFEEALRKSVSACRSEGRDKLLVVPSFNFALLVSDSDRLDALRRMEVRNSAGSQMYARGKDEWTMLLLSYDSSEALRFAWPVKVDASSFQPSDWKIVRSQGEELKKGLRQ